MSIIFLAPSLRGMISSVSIFTFQTHDAYREYVWLVHMETQEITPASADAKKMMDLVELYD